MLDRAVAERMTATLAEISCGDSSCLFAPLRRIENYPPRVVTNGGCRCFQALERETQRRLHGGLMPLIRALVALKDPPQ